jgi:hypothetical protein
MMQNPYVRPVGPSRRGKDEPGSFFEFQLQMQSHDGQRAKRKALLPPGCTEIKSVPILE